MHTHPYNAITLDNGAKLILTPCPGSKGAGIESSITVLKQAGTSMLLTLMFDNDMEKNNITSLPAQCEKNKIAWLQLPIVDDGAPCEIFDRLWFKHIDAIITVLDKQGTITIHCKGGYGRTGLVAGLILLCYGLTAEQAMAKVQAVRSQALKSTVQFDYFYAFFKKIKK